MHRWVTQTCSNSQQKQLPQSFFFFFFSPSPSPSGTGYKIHNSRQSGYSDRHKNL